MQAEKRKYPSKPAFWGTKVQLPIPWLATYASIFASSSAVQGPLFTLALSQQGGLPIKMIMV